MKTQIDQSTQVSFPVVPKSLQKKLRRYHTSADLVLQNRHCWTQIKSTDLSRPRSLNISETFIKSRICNDSPPARLTIPFQTSDAQLGSISRERTPPFSCNSSVVSASMSGFRNYPVKTRLNIQDEDSSGYSSKCACRCTCNFDDASKKAFHNSANELSWRRLHMSRAKLKATSTTSELLSGFAMVAMVELQINEPTNVPEWLFVVFAVCTTVLVSVHIFALMISTYILPNIDAIAKLDICDMVSESPHERMRGYIEIAWAFSTVLGLFLFLVEVAILCWVKFWDYSFPAAVASTIVVIPVLIIFVLFAVHFYHSLVVYRVNTSVSDMEKNFTEISDDCSICVSFKCSAITAGKLFNEFLCLYTSST